MKNNLLLALLCFAGLLCCNCSEDETPSTGSVYGIITNSETGDPIRNAEVILSPGNTTTISGNDGHYEFLDLEPGQYKIQVQANGYGSNSRQISVALGSSTPCDILLTPVQSGSGISFSNTTVDFGTDYSTLRIDIYNNGTSGAVSWNISNITEQWLTVSPLSGKIAMNGSETLSVNIDRSKISNDATAFFTVNAAGRAQTIMVIVNSNTSSGGNTGGDSGKDDYSSASISSCDSRISADIISCKRSGSSVVFTYSLTNTSSNISDFRIYAVGPTTYSDVSDDAGHTYTYQDSKFAFGGNSPSGSSIISTSLPTNAKKNGTITLNNVSTNAKKLYISIYCTAYPASVYNLESNYITFSEVPIY
ncbi:MAG: carboxypeptidase regulatory-like domain-containing protein [Alistipes sp.]|nr:carboxypeptidase regulatory-like domain-containing protein [Alistipes senegalensis]MCM1250831.1 carboxypeptidase regulatory-like domain-containing protein [Alistipes sp.]